jgi:hypothetical protein
VRFVQAGFAGAAVRKNGNDFVGLLVRDPQVYLGKLPRLRRAFNGANRALGFADLNLNLSGLTVTTEEVQDAILWHLEARRGGFRSAGW